MLQDQSINNIPLRTCSNFSCILRSLAPYHYHHHYNSTIITSTCTITTPTTILWHRSSAGIRCRCVISRVIIMDHTVLHPVSTLPFLCFLDLVFHVFLLLALRLFITMSAYLYSSSRRLKEFNTSTRKLINSDVPAGWSEVPY
jgi:hypothetical protein